MKITIWIRPKSVDDDTPMMRVDAKYENRDTPTLQRYGRMRLAALGCKGKLSMDEGVEE